MQMTTPEFTKNAISARNMNGPTQLNFHAALKLCKKLDLHFAPQKAFTNFENKKVQNHFNN